MALTDVYSLDRIFSSNIKKNDGNELVTDATMRDTIAEEAKTIIAGGKITFKVSQASSEDCWPKEISTIPSGAVLHFRLQFRYGSSDLTLANKAITVTMNAEIARTWGEPIETGSVAVTTLVVARAAGVEPLYCDVLWYMYTV